MMYPVVLALLAQAQELADPVSRLTNNSNPILAGIGGLLSAGGGLVYFLARLKRGGNLLKRSVESFAETQRDHVNVTQEVVKTLDHMQTMDAETRSDLKAIRDRLAEINGRLSASNTGGQQ